MNFETKWWENKTTVHWCWSLSRPYNFYYVSSLIFLADAQLTSRFRSTANIVRPWGVSLGTTNGICLLVESAPHIFVSNEAPICQQYSREGPWSNYELKPPCCCCLCSLSKFQSGCFNNTSFCFTAGFHYKGIKSWSLYLSNEICSSSLCPANLDPRPSILKSQGRFSGHIFFLTLPQCLLYIIFQTNESRFGSINVVYMTGCIHYISAVSGFGYMDNVDDGHQYPFSGNEVMKHCDAEEEAFWQLGS